MKSQFIESLAERVINGEVRALAKAITLIESRKSENYQYANELMKKILPQTGRSKRIGISGFPGSGKSTFINKLGKALLAKGERLAVLAVDPTSPISQGSILGDKTRMAEITQHPNTFIRPSPAGRQRGGVNRATRESILLCEAAGYSTVIVETVGTGQSETDVASMTDLFVVLQLPNAGDELQGIKKGILEIADLIIVTKADGDQLANAKIAKQTLISSLQLTRPSPTNLETVLLLSNLSGLGFPETVTAMEKFLNLSKQTGELQKRRTSQADRWYDDAVRKEVWSALETQQHFRQLSREFRRQVQLGKLTPPLAAQELARSLFINSRISKPQANG